ncbi:MAG: malto-oligosyltrehalose trehalohydrolase [Vulcanimicrobiaceae bacterium]
MRYRHRLPFGAELVEGGVRFRLYAPAASSVELRYGDAALGRRAPLEPCGDGFFERVVADAAAGTRYAFAFESDALLVPDPASRFQPEGVHRPSAVVDPYGFDWAQPGAPEIPWHAQVLYELHVGAFTPEGTYRAAAARLDDLVSLGVTTLEMMPLATAPGGRNWGYDGVYLYAPSPNYGTPDELKAFVQAAHAKGLRVLLDAVYNHFGPEGNYLGRYAPNFFTERHHTPWGAAIDFESPGNAPVRAFFIENALYWLLEYRFDGLRLDAVDRIHDEPERDFLRELAATVASRLERHRSVELVLENDFNEAALLRAGYRAQWNDDVHHAAHVLLTKQSDGYYRDFATDPAALLGRALTSGFAYQGEASAFRDGRKRGEPSADLQLSSFVTFLQNHDQIGNRALGERIAQLAPHEALRAGLALLLLAPSPPLLFMGEEWAASTPFLFFCDFEPELAEKVTEGRRAEFVSFPQFADPSTRDAIPDPSEPATFVRSKLNWGEREAPPHRLWLEYYRALLHLRTTEIAPRLAGLRGSDAEFERTGVSGLRARWRLAGATQLRLAANLGPEPGDALPTLPQHAKLIFATHDFRPHERAPDWSVRWSIE